MLHAALRAGGVALLLASVACRGGPPGAAGGAGAPPGRGRPVPVAVAPVEARDLPVALDGLGSVAGFYTVTVRPQVGGRLDSVDFVEGQRVRRGQRLAQIDPRPFTIALHQAEASMAHDAAVVRDARLVLERTAALREGGLVPQQQLDDARAAADQGAAALLASQAQVEAARLQLDYATITSPLAGRTGVRRVDPGNVVQAGDPNGLVVVVQTDPIAVLVSLPEDALPTVNAALRRGPVAAEALARDGSRSLGRGTVALVDNQINQASGTLRLKAVFANADDALWPNQFVRARLEVDTLRGVLTVPAAALQRGAEGSRVFVVEQGAGAAPHATLRPVEVARQVGDVAVVAHGLRAGEQVVVDGQQQLRDGGAVVVGGARSGPVPAARGPPP